MYYLYKKAQNIYEKSMNLVRFMKSLVPKQAKANGTRWISHKFTSMNIFLKNYCIFITHLESLANTDSQALKHMRSKVTLRNGSMQNFHCILLFI